MRRITAVIAAACAIAGVIPQAIQAQTAGAPLRPYRINPGDELEVYVWGEERLSRTIKVLPDGTISFPLVGQVNALGKLPRDVEAEITTGLRPKYRDAVPQVTVSVKNAIGMQFSIVGKVKSPGAYTTGRYINVLEALALAGGPAEFADTNGVRIARKSGQVIRVRLGDALKGNISDRDLTNLPSIESGDTVIVP